MFVFQLYTISQDAALCVWQCDTELDGLKPMPRKDAAKENSAAKNDEEFSEESKGEEIRGKANPSEQETRNKVKYSRVAK